MPRYKPTHSAGLKLKPAHIAVLAALALLLSAGAYAAFFMGGADDADNAESAVTDAPAIFAANNGFEIDTSAGAYTAPAPADEIPAGIKMPGWGDITLRAGETTAKIQLLNPEGNACYMKFTLVLTDEDSEELLYESGYVPPGQVVAEQTLSRALDSGEYSAAIYINPVSMDETHTPLSGGVARLRIIVV
jgi:hypothetical protein